MNINQNDDPIDKKLFDALYEVMQTRTIEEITVSDILEKTGVSRSSFYRHFKDKYDLLTGSYQRLLDSTYLQCLNGRSWKESAAALFRVLYEHPRFFRHALEDNGLNSLRSYICQISMECYRQLFAQHGADLTRDWRLRGAAQVHVYGTCEVMCQWVRSGFPQKPEEMIDLFFEIMPDMLRPFCGS